MSAVRFFMEIGVEEMPSQYVLPILGSLTQGVSHGLVESRLYHEPLSSNATPRRLVLWGTVLARQTTKQTVVKGPLLSVAYDSEGRPTPALAGFCRRVALDPDKLHRIEDNGKLYLAATVSEPVQSADAILPEVFSQAFQTLPLPRSMRWGLSDYRFIRPVRWLAMWIGGELAPLSLDGVSSQAITYGNRTDHPEALSYDDPDQYWSCLEEGRVILPFETRQLQIMEQGQQLAKKIGGRVDWDAELLAEVSNLVEWPTPFLGSFDETYLSIPASVLVTSMKVHQRYFPLYDNRGMLLPAFIGVRNGIGDHLDLVVRGNQKVLRARLADAQYFFNLDRTAPLSAHLPALRQVIFHAKMGTYGEKLERMHRLWHETQSWWDLDPAEAAVADQVIDLYKTDLLTHVVQEFPELEGEMGAIYARLEGESPLIADAIGEQYQPKSPTDDIPQTRLGQWLVLMDRVDTLVLAYAAGLKPSGSEDPFALRRAALAVGRVFSEVNASLLRNRTVREMIGEVAYLHQISDTVVDDVYELVVQRLTNYLQPEFSGSLVQAALRAPQPWNRLRDRIRWMMELTQDESWVSVAQAFKRAHRVLLGDGGEPVPVELADLGEPVERNLWLAIKGMESESLPLEAWWDAAKKVAVAIHAVFDQVLVMDPDAVVKQRRLSLLRRANQRLGQYFDLSVVE